MSRSRAVLVAVAVIMSVLVIFGMMLNGAARVVRRNLARGCGGL